MGSVLFGSEFQIIFYYSLHCDEFFAMTRRFSDAIVKPGTVSYMDVRSGDMLYTLVLRCQNQQSWGERERLTSVVYSHLTRYIPA